MQDKQVLAQTSTAGSKKLTPPVSSLMICSEWETGSASLFRNLKQRSKNVESVILYSLISITLKGTYFLSQI